MHARMHVRMYALGRRRLDRGLLTLPPLRGRRLAQVPLERARVQGEKRGRRRAVPCTLHPVPCTPRPTACTLHRRPAVEKLLVEQPDGEWQPSDLCRV